MLIGAVALHRFNPQYWPPLAVDIMHSLHGSGFAVLALFVYWVLRFRYPTKFNYLPAAGITFGIGVVSELAQIPGPREAQISDLIVDGLGILGALGIVAAFDRSVRALLSRPLRMLLPTLSGIALSIACTPSVWYSYALVQQYMMFPQLVTFEHRWERATYDQTDKRRPSLVAAPADWPVEGNTVALAEESGRWGIFISIDPPPDWRGYSSLSFVVASTTGDFVMDIGIRDMKKDSEHQGVRFYKTFPVGAEPQTVIVPFDEIRQHAQGRPLDFALVEAVVLSAAEPGSGATILVDDFRLNP